MSIDHHIYIGAVVVCRHPAILNPATEFDNLCPDETLYAPAPMCGDELVEGADVYVPNTGGLRHSLYLDGKCLETAALPLPHHADAAIEFRQRFADELDELRSLYSKVEICTGVYTWAT
jgi:hypothetical protein